MGWIFLCVSESSCFAKEPSRTVAAQTQTKRFFDNGDGTVLDSQTGLMWAAQDNGSNITWQDAKAYCENYKGGGFADWRMPTIEELRSIYDMHYSRIPECSNKYPNLDPIHITPLIHLSCSWIWSSELQGVSVARLFDFNRCCESLSALYGSFPPRTLPVRTTRK